MDLTKLALRVVENVRLFVQPALDAIDVRIDEIKAAVDELRSTKPLDRAAIDTIVAEAVAKIPPPADGKDADPADIAHAVNEALAAANVHDMVAVAVSDAVPQAARSAAQAAVEALPKPQDGQSVTIDDVAPLVQEAVDKAVSAIPAPKDGTSVTLDEVLPDLRADVQKWFDALPRPKDGDSITLGDVLPALENMQAKWELDFERRATEFLQRTVDRFPKPKDGDPGRDGFGFDDLSFEQLSERSAVIRFKRGDAVKEFPIALAGFVDRGLWQEGEFDKGDGVTWDGNYWLARRATSVKPGTEGEDTGNNDWRIAVRKGRKGKDGKDFTPRGPVQPPKLKS